MLSGNDPSSRAANIIIARLTGTTPREIIDVGGGMELGVGDRVYNVTCGGKRFEIRGGMAMENEHVRDIVTCVGAGDNPKIFIFGIAEGDATPDQLESWRSRMPVEDTGSSPPG